MNEGKPSAWVDALLTLWVAVVGLIYFGGYLSPEIGALTAGASAFYALMVFVTVLTLAFRYLRRSSADVSQKRTHTKRA